jgi:hypothetical protein
MNFIIYVNLETPTNMNSKKLEIEHGAENSEELALQIISKIKEKLDCCYDKNGPSAQIGSEPLWNAIAQLKYKGTKLRLITEITKENIAYCKTMMRYFDVRHIDGVKGNFGISDGVEYIGNMLAFDGKPGTQLIHMNDKPFIELQQFLFDTLWNKAIQAREKIKEIELGLDKEFVETIRNPLEIQQLVHNLLKSATYEILILFSSINSFYRAKQENILEMLKESVERGVNVRLLAPAEDDAIKEISEKKLKERRKQIYIQHIRKPLQTNIITIIIDQSISLSIEINDDTKETLRESTGLATYSNSESNVSSCASIFESLWIQSELDKQNKIKQVYFQVFKGFGLKDETYKRSWQNENS